MSDRWADSKERDTAMEVLVYVMAILGCGESDAPCRQVALAPARYESEAQCLSDLENQLLRRDDLVFPSVVAQCRPADTRPELLRGSDVMLPAPDRDLNRSPRFASADVGAQRY